MTAIPGFSTTPIDTDLFLAVSHLTNDCNVLFEGIRGRNAAFRIIKHLEPNDIEILNIIIAKRLHQSDLTLIQGLINRTDGVILCSRDIPRDITVGIETDE